jgi:pimeloyl-ACP methyl ester carboxylesterase
MMRMIQHDHHRARRPSSWRIGSAQLWMLVLPALMMTVTPRRPQRQSLPRASAAASTGLGAVLAFETPVPLPPSRPRVRSNTMTADRRRTASTSRRTFPLATKTATPTRGGGGGSASRTATARRWVDDDNTDAAAAGIVDPDGTPAAAPPPTSPGIAKIKVQRYHETWEWRHNGRTHKINYRVEGGGKDGNDADVAAGRPAVLLVHGFGANLNHFRYTIPALVREGYRVYAMDLLGFGGSEKPADPLSVGFSVELFAQQMIDFMASRRRHDDDDDDEDDKGLQQQQRKQRWILAGNSIGGLCSLLVASRASSEGALPFEISSLVLFNSAGGMTGFRYSDIPPLLHPLMAHVQYFVLGPLHGPLLYSVLAQKTTLRPVLQSAGIYRDPANVDEELLSIILGPALDGGARDVFLAVYGGPAGPTREELLPHVTAPVLALWGGEDGFTPCDDAVRALPALHGGNDMVLEVIPDAGHCLHDECPDAVNSRMVAFLKKKSDP